MKSPILFSLLLIGTISFAQTKANVKVTDDYSITDSNINKIYLDLSGGNIEVTPWAHSRVVVETKITSSNVNREVINAIVKTERYALDNETTASTLTLSNDVEAQDIIIRGKHFDENISYRVYVPQNAIVYDKNTNQSIVAKTTVDTNKESFAGKD